MDTLSSKHSMNAVRMETVQIELHAMYGDRASIKIGLRDPKSYCGLGVGFHITAAEARELAARLVEYADAAEASQAKLAVSSGEG